MSDHIQKLADKAKKSVPHGLTPDKWIEVYNQKFAELIIQECCDVLMSEMNRLNSLNRLVASNTIATAPPMIKEHFGVE